MVRSPSTGRNALPTVRHKDMSELITRKETFMSFSSWRGVVGMVNPTMRPGMTEEVCRLLPEGIGLIPLFLNISRGTEDEFASMMPHYEKLVAVLAEQKCDVIHPNGAPPFMVHGFAGEAKIIAAWEQKYQTPIMSVAQNHVRALKAVKARSFVGATYFPDKLNAIFAQYFTDAGFEVRGMDERAVAVNQGQELSAERIYAHIKKSFLAHKGADPIYMLGSGWRRTCRCRWCIRSPRESGNSRSGCMCASRAAGLDLC